MSRKSNWYSPPKYSGARHNKRAVKTLAKMCFGLGAMATAKQHTVAKRLESIGASLTIKAASAGHKAFIQANILAIFEDLVNLRRVLSDGEYEIELESCLDNLDANVKVLSTFLEHEIDDSPLEAHINRHIRKFIAKKSAVEAIARATESSLATAQKKLGIIQAENSTNNREKIIAKRKIANLKGFIKLRVAAANTLSSIVDRLNELEDTAKLSSGLARRINHLIKLKPLADFYDKPVRSQQERNKLFAHLYYLAQNVVHVSEEMELGDNVLNGITNPKKPALSRTGVDNKGYDLNDIQRKRGGIQHNYNKKIKLNGGNSYERTSVREDL